MSLHQRPLIILPLLVLILGCDRAERSTQNVASTRPAHAASDSVAAPAPSGATIAIQSAGGAPAFQITPGPGDIKVSFAADGQSSSIEGRRHSSGKRKYAKNGQLIAEVKPTDSGFKVRSPDGKQLYWKIKREADKVKISDNEQNNHPFVLQSKSDRIEVLGTDGRSLGAVRADSAGHRTVAEDSSGQIQFTVVSDHSNRFLGVALMKEIPVAMRAIILAELSSLDR